MTPINSDSLIQNDQFSRLAANSLVQGDLTFACDTYLQGTIEGTVTLKNSSPTALLSLGESAHVKGRVEAPRIQISGTIIGDVFASTSVEITHLGHVQGNIHTPSLTVQTGAIFRGHSHLLKSSQLT